MHRAQGVLVLLVLFIGFAHSFFWDIVVGDRKHLKFYYNGEQLHTEDLPASIDVTAITYDPVHHRVLFADYNMSKTIFSFDLSTRKLDPVLTRNTHFYLRNLAYDPVTELIFWAEDEEIYSFSLKPASSNKAVDGNLIVTSDDYKDYCRDIAVDSCGGFIYWITNNKIEKAAFDGSKREVLIDSAVESRKSLAIDQQTQKMYWIEITNKNDGNQLYIESADLNGKNRRTLYFIENEYAASSLVISKDYIYWKSKKQRAILQLLKNPPHDAVPKFYSNASIYFWDCQLTAANYTIKEQTQGTKSCEDLKSLIPNSECTQDCTDEECNVSSCQNYCLQGNCSVNTEGQPKCSCKAGYSGKRCEVNACHNYCSYNGICSLNEENEPVCDCTADYEGVRCDVPTTHTGGHTDKTTPRVLRDLYSALKRVIKEELKHTLQFYSDKIDENEAKIQKCEKSITDIKNHINT